MSDGARDNSSDNSQENVSDGSQDNVADRTQKSLSQDSKQEKKGTKATKMSCTAYFTKNQPVLPLINFLSNVISVAFPVTISYNIQHDNLVF